MRLRSGIIKQSKPEQQLLGEAFKIEKEFGGSLLKKSHAKRFGVKIYRYANVGNHIHLLVRAKYRKGFISFLRAISGVIARIVLGAERGHAKLKEATTFWDQRPWTRVLAWMKDFENVKKYVQQNFNEAMGFVPYKPRKHSSTA